MRSYARLFLAVSLLASGARADVGGIWSGSVTVTDRCNSAPIRWSTPLTLAIGSVSGAEVTGNVFFASVPIFDARCATERTTSVAVSFKGRAANDVLNAGLVFRGRPLELSATIRGSSMDVTFSNPDFHAAGTLTQSSTQPPPSLLTGFYAGTYTSTEVVERCRNLTSITSAGPLTANVVQTGMFVTATGTISGGRRLTREADGTCSALPAGDLLFQLSGQINGNAINGMVLDASGVDAEMIPFTGTFGNGTISGSSSSARGNSSFTMTRSTAPPPSIVAFSATPSTLGVGEAATLSWQTSNATSVMLDHGIGRRPASGSMPVRPRATTVFKLTAIGPGGTVESSVTVTVPPQPRVVLSAFPRGFVQQPDQGGGTDRFTLSNVGEAATTVTLATAANFFTFSPAAVALAPGESRTVTITGLPQPAGVYGGTVNFSGAGVLARGVLVRMLSAAAPTGVVRARATRARAEIRSSAGQSASGTVEFSNDGAVPLAGVAVSDVEWLVPSSAIVVISPGQTVAVPFTADIDKRPDREAPLGAVSGTISLVFPRGASSEPMIAGAGPSTSTVSVSLVYVVQPGVTPGVPAPLAEGELARFAPGLPNRSSAKGDLLVSNSLTSAALEPIQLFLQGGGAPTQSTTISQLLPNSSVSLPGLVGSVFGGSVQSGTVQVRGADVSKASIAAVMSNTTSPVGTYSAALPVFRSDRSAGTNGSIVLSGIEQSAAVATELFVQETSGKSGSFGVDFLDSAGSVIGARASEAIAAFGFAQLRDAVPAGAAAARIVNTATSGTLAGYGLVSNASTGDGWPVTDPAAGSGTDETHVVPILHAGSGASTLLYTTNRGTEPVAVSIDVVGAGSGRRRIVRRGSGETEAGKAASTLGPLQTTTTALLSSGGWVRLSAPAASITAAARSTVTSGASAWGGGLPVVPFSDAMRAGETKRFAGVDDAAAASRDGAVPATFRTNLLLVEAGGQEAVVRVTLQFAFSGGSLASSSARVSRNYTVAANQALLVADLARNVVGASRDSFGDLRDMIVDVEVISGTGRIVPFVQSFDNGTGDMIVRAE